MHLHFHLSIQLTEANKIIGEEIHKLDHNADDAFEAVNNRYQDILDTVEKKRQEALQQIREKRDEKKKVLEDQLQTIQNERKAIDADVQASQQQVDVKSITKAIAELNDKVNTVSTLAEPIENHYIVYMVDEEKSKGLLKKISEDLTNPQLGGRIRTSKTLPSNCRCSILGNRVWSLLTTV